MLKPAAENWINVPTNSILTIHDQTAFVQPIIDQFHHKDPWHRRSAGFVQSKGLAANEKTAPPLAMPNPAVAAPEGNLQAEMFHRRANLGPTIPFSLMRSITPQITRTVTPEAPSGIAASPRPSLSTVDTSKSTDFRTVTAPPVSRQASYSNPPALGNIKKKRMSLNNLDQLHGPSPSSEPPTPLSPVDRTSYGDPNKIAQFFPELTLSP